MSSCQPDKLEALLHHELPAAEMLALDAHLAHCPHCVRELEWLSAEQELLTQRARREQVRASTWNELSRRLQPPAAPQPPRWMQVGLPLMAACLLLVLWAPGHLEAPAPESMAAVNGAGELADSQEPVNFSLDPQSVIGGLERRFQACLVATPGCEVPCAPSPTIPASFATP